MCVWGGGALCECCVSRSPGLRSMRGRNMWDAAVEGAAHLLSEIQKPLGKWRRDTPQTCGVC